VNAVATRSGGELDVLLWNYHDADVAAADPPITVIIDGLRGDRVTVSEFLMDAIHSNAYWAWQQMGSPAQPKADQQSQLEEAGMLYAKVRDQLFAVHQGKIKLDVVLPRQGVMLIRLQTGNLKR
jgi:xylan 1,4-beta-xylosidase